MRNEIIELLNEISDKEIDDFYIYMYDECKTASSRDKRRHIYCYMRTYLKHHKQKEEFSDKYMIIYKWLKGREAKLKT